MTVYISELKELNGECCQTTCSEPATVYVFWPGQGKKSMCPEHGAKAQRIASSMGFTVHVEEINASNRTTG